MKYYLSVPCVGCPWVSQRSQRSGLPHCALLLFLSLHHHAQLSTAFPFLLISEDKGGPTHGH